METLTKKEFMKRCFKWVGIVGMAIAVLNAFIFVVIGGHVIEESVFAEFAKWIVGGAFVVGILEVFTYVLGQFAYDFWYRKKHDVPYDGEA